MQGRNHYKAWSYKKKKHKKLKHTCKEFQSLVVRRKKMQSIRITTKVPTKKRKWDQLNQFSRTSTKVITTEKA